MNAARCVPSVLVMLSPCLAGADYYVDNLKGNDAFSGRTHALVSGTTGPLATIAKAIALVKPGDTIHLNRTGKLYRQSAVFSKGGEPGKPITLDGHGVTLSGADPCPGAAWQAWCGGVLRRPKARSIGFLLVDGRMVFERYARDALRPGEFCYEFNTLYGCPPKGKALQQCAIQVGQPDGATVTLDPKVWHASHSKRRTVRRYRGLELGGHHQNGVPLILKLDGADTPLVVARDRLEPGMWCNHDGDLYFRQPPDTPIGRLQIECVVRPNGVGMSGRFGHVIVKNLTAIHMGNDGYNIHGKVTAAEFYNCNAHHCFDEGFSSHDDCETLLDGAVYGFCDNAIANVNRSGYSITRNVVLHHSRHVGFLIQAHGNSVHHELTGAVLYDNPHQISAAHLKADNVLIVTTSRAARQNATALSCGAHVKLGRLTWVNGSFRADRGSSVLIRRALVGPTHWHVRADDPLAVLRLDRVVAHPDCVMEWGSTYPWKRLPMGMWLRQARAKGVAKGCAVRVVDALDALRRGRRPNAVPKGIGCDPALWRRLPNR